MAVSIKLLKESFWWSKTILPLLSEALILQSYVRFGHMAFELQLTHDSGVNCWN